MFEDIKVIYKNDPAAKGIQFILYPGFHAIVVHRYIAHPLYKLKLRFWARLVSQIARFFSGIEIHPGAIIGKGFFIDHGSAIVIGETAVLGDNCTVFHNVTIGGTGKHKGKRHPTVGNNVLFGTGATVLGPVTVGNNVKIGAETVVIMRDIPSNCTVVGAPGKIVKINGIKMEIPLERTKEKE